MLSTAMPPGGMLREWTYVVMLSGHALSNSGGG
jgi:hypothetical protein